MKIYSKKNPKKVALICSSGGHFLQLYSLKKFWSQVPHFWITFSHEDTKCLLKGEQVYHAFSPTNRSLKNLVRNLFLAFKILLREKPDLVISTGAGVAVPFLMLSKLFFAKTIYIESLTRVSGLSLTGKLLYVFTDMLFVQWPEMAVKYKKAHYMGQVI